MFFKSHLPAFLLFSLSCIVAGAKVVEYDLTIAQEPWAPAGMKPVSSLTVNGGIPGPTLRFEEGDIARIRVHNRLPKETTSIHWHGLLVPNAQDGVPDVTTPKIAAGTTHTFEFPLKHSGTYWYHSHTGLQEQRGVYGSIVIEPRGKKDLPDQVLVLSDWTRENPYEVMRTLMRGSEWYALKKGSSQSLLGAAKAGALSDFFHRERARMPAMDLSDVAYDAFLINGGPTAKIDAKPGQSVKLRVINASASTYFYLQSATGPLTIVAADGPTVKPVKVNRLLMGVAETYDVVIRIPEYGRWEVRATAQDGSGHASAYAGSGDDHPAPDIPRADLYRMDATVLAALEEKDRGRQSEAEALRTEPARPLSPYALLRSPTSTKFPSNLPRRSIELRMTGDMERYIWSFNGKTVSEDGVIKVKRGEVLRLELINDSMMHHPIHLHGHFFRVIEDGRADAPLKHTVDVPPMSRRTIEFEANEYGDWLFHCHLLYHMHAGMARVFSYDDQGAGHQPSLGEMNENPLYFILDGTIQSHMSMGMAALMNTRNDFYVGWDLGAMDGYDDPDYEIDVGWRRYFNPNFSTYLGWRFTNEEDARDRAFAAIQYRFPYLITSSLQVDSQGDARLGLNKAIMLTDRLGLFGGVQYDTGSEWEWTLGADYMLTKRLSLVTQYHSDHGFGGGIGFRF